MVDNDMINIAKLAIGLMGEHGLLKKGWKFGFDFAKVRFGCCDFTSKTISLSYSICLCNLEENPNAITDTIIHEIAHALAYIKVRSSRHCKQWKQIFISIGGDGKATYDPEEENVVEPSFNYIYECPACHGKLYRYNIIHAVACSDCCEKNNTDWDEKYVFKLKKKLRRVDRINEC